MSKQIHMGIPTEYRGVRFRSRLEARWAVFMDRVDWGWQYEPLDLDGYIPDFVVRFDGGPLLIEVKPALTLDELRESTGKITASGWEHEALIVGADLFEPGHVHPIVGLIGEREPGPDGELCWFWDAARLFSCLSCGQPSVLSEAGSWRCRVCGAVDGHLGTFAKGAAVWVDSANRVQWRAGA